MNIRALAEKQKPHTVAMLKGIHEGLRELLVKHIKQIGLPGFFLYVEIREPVSWKILDDWLHHPNGGGFAKGEVTIVEMQVNNFGLVFDLDICPSLDEMEKENG